MENHLFAMPSSKINQGVPKVALPCPFTASGMLQPSSVQPPPMFGPRGATIPPKHMGAYKNKFHQNNRPNTFSPRQHNNNFNKPRHAGSYNRPYGQRPEPYQRRPYEHQQSREFFCETCDRDFKTADLIAEHRLEHQKCGIDGCSFEGHEKVVSLHIQTQHSTGLYEKIKNLNTPEDIEKWRTERRKRYPTKANVEVRQQIQEERMKRGERLEESKNRFANRKGDMSRDISGNNHSKTQSEHGQTKQDGGTEKPKRKRQRKSHKKSMPRTIVEKVVNEMNEHTIEMNGPFQAFCGTSTMNGYKRTASQQLNPLSSLLAMYGSDEENSNDTSTSDVDEDPIVHKILTLPTEDEQPSIVVIENKIDTEEPIPVEAEMEELSESEKPDEIPVARNTDSNIEVLNIEPSENSGKEVKRTRYNQHTKNAEKQRKKPTTILDLSKRYRNQNTMLEKLLQKDIRHERNVLLQCVRYVVQENFFGIGAKKE